MPVKRVRNWLIQRRKALAALAGVVLGWGPVAQALHFSAAAWWALGAGLGGVFGVHAVANEQPWQPAAKDDAGQGIITVLLAILLVIVILALLGVIQLGGVR